MIIAVKLCLEPVLDKLITKNGAYIYISLTFKN